MRVLVACLGMAVVGAGGILTAGCGVQNPYKDRPKRCKAGCEPAEDRTSPRQTPPLAFDAAGWEEASAAQDITEKDLQQVGAFVKQNPFKLGLALESFQKAAKEAATAVAAAAHAAGGATLNANRACLVQAFTAPATRADGQISVTADYGKCQGLALRDKHSDTPGVVHLYKEYEEGFRLATSGSQQLALKLGLTGDVQNATQLDRLFPFRALNLSDVPPDGGAEANTHFSKVNIETVDIREGDKTLGTVRSWVVFSVGLDETQKFSIRFDPEDDTVTVNGSIVFAQGEVVNPKAPDSFEGESKAGFFVRYFFRDFKMRGGINAPGTQLGYSDGATLQGSYFLQVNNLFFRLEGQNKPCQAKAYQAVFDEEGKDRDSFLWDFNLCGM